MLASQDDLLGGQQVLDQYRRVSPPEPVDVRPDSTGVAENLWTELEVAQRLWTTSTVRQTRLIRAGPGSTRRREPQPGPF